MRIGFRHTRVLALTGLGKTKIYELQAQGDFPMRVQLSPKVSLG